MRMLYFAKKILGVKLLSLIIIFQLLWNFVARFPSLIKMHISIPNEPKKDATVFCKTKWESFSLLAFS